MSSDDMGALVLALSMFIASAHILGYLFERLAQPRLMGEILAGVLLGPFALGYIAPVVSITIFGDPVLGVGKTDVVLNFIYWIGLFLLMFISGSETRRLMARENQRATAWLVGIGTPLPFLLVLALPLGATLSPELIMGTAQQTTSALLVLAVAVAVTSIPVISRIFHDLNILHTRFASLVLGTAVLEDIILWAVLAFAASLANSASAAEAYGIQEMAVHTATTLFYMSIGLFGAPAILKHVHNARWNLLVKASPVGYLFVILFVYAAVASMLGVNLIFASFLAGFGLVGGVTGGERARFSDSLESIARVSFGIFIPIYFAIVGYKLVLGRDFSPSTLAVFLVVSSLLKLLSVGLAAKFAGFRKLDIVNLAITTNARGGPGIVLASVAFDAGIINAQFYTTLVLTAVLTSQAAGAWLRFVLGRGWPLLSTNPTETWYKAEVEFASKMEESQKNVA